MAEKVKYQFNGQTYTIKGRLCHDIVKYYVEQNPNATLATLQKAFNTATHMIVATPEMALTVFTSDGKAGGDYYMKDEDQIAIKNGKIVVWSYWPESYFKPFLAQVKSLGLDVEVIDGKENVEAKEANAFGAQPSDGHQVMESGCQIINGVCVIPEGTTIIEENAFSGCEELNSVVIPKTVTTIGRGAFEKTGLTSVFIPDSVTEIGDCAFYGCKSLKSAVIEANLKKIPAPFYNCRSLETITFPESIGKIDKEFFYGCYSLKTIYVPAKRAEYYKKRVHEDFHGIIVELPGDKAPTDSKEVAAESPLDKAVAKIKKSMKDNGLSVFYLFSGDYYFALREIFEDVKKAMPKEALEDFDSDDVVDFLDYGQLEFGVSYWPDDDGGYRTYTIRKIENKDDELLFNVDEVDYYDGNHRLKLHQNQTIDDLKRFTPNQTEDYNVEIALKNIADHYIDNPFLIAASKVADFDLLDYCD